MVQICQCDVKNTNLSSWLFLSCCETLIRTQPHLSKILYRLKIQVPSALICKPRVRTWSWIKITTYLSMLMYSAKHSAMCPTRAFDRNGKKIWTCESIEPQTSQVCILMTGLSFPSDLSEYITKWKDKKTTIRLPLTKQNRMGALSVFLKNFNVHF